MVTAATMGLLWKLRRDIYEKRFRIRKEGRGETNQSPVCQFLLSEGLPGQMFSQREHATNYYWRPNNNFKYCGFSILAHFPTLIYYTRPLNLSSSSLKASLLIIEVNKYYFAEIFQKILCSCAKCLGQFSK